MDNQQAAAIFAALAHPSRLDVVCMLARCGPPGISAGEIAKRLKIAPPSLSFHLQQLLHAGVLLQRRNSRHLIYALDFENDLVVRLIEPLLTKPKIGKKRV